MLIGSMEDAKGSATEAHEAEVCDNELAKGSIDDIYRLMRRDNRFVSSAHGTLEDLEDEILSNISVSREVDRGDNIV